MSVRAVVAPSGGGVPVGVIVPPGGTPGTIPVWSTGTTLTNSGITDNGSTVTFVSRNLASSAAQTWTLASSTTALNIASNLLVFDTTNARIGIGTASPGTRLHVNAGNGIRVTDATGTAGFDMVNFAGDAYLYNRNTGVLVFGSSNTERMRINSAGAGAPADSQVAIGTTTFASGARLSLGGASSTTVKLSYLNGSSEIGFSSMNGATGEWRHQAGLNVGGWGGFHAFYTDTSEKVRITNAGNVHAASGTTTMTDGFFYIPAAAGAPTGTPTAIAGRVPMYYDTTNNEFYVYNTAWKKVALL